MSYHTFEEFIIQKKSDWMAKVEKDLKGKAIEDLYHNISSDWTLSPFLTQEDIPSAPAPLVLDGQWAIVQDIRHLPTQPDIPAIVEMLEAGVNVLKMTSSQWKYLQSSDKILWNMIGLMIEKQEEKHSISLPSSSTGVILTNGGTTENLSQPYPLYDIGISIPMENVENIPASLAEALWNWVQHLDKISDSEAQNTWDRMYLDIKVGNQYILEICKMRATHILFSHLAAEYHLRYRPFKLTTIHNSIQLHSPYDSLIAYTSAALSAAIGGCNWLCIPGLEGEDVSDSFKLRMVRNIQHILQMESYITKVKDPAAGSYVLESITSDIVQKAWSLFLERIGDFSDKSKNP